MCQIQWAFNSKDWPKPCDQPSIGRVRYRRHVQQIRGRGVWVGDEDRYYEICAKHALMLDYPGMGQWEFTPTQTGGLGN